MGFRDFFRPAWQHSVVSKRERAVRNLEDPALAALIFRTDASPAVKHAALERLIALDRRQTREVWVLAIGLKDGDRLYIAGEEFVP